MGRGRTVSAKMLAARELILKGATPYRAAKDAGVTITGITRSDWYREHIATQAEPDVGETAIERARRLVVVDGKTAYAAAKLTGIAQSTISRSAWYRAHIDGGKYAAKNR